MMAETASIVYGVSSMIGWGCGDYLSKRIVGDIGHFRLLLYIQLVSIMPILALAAVFTPTVPSSLTAVALVVAAAACSSCGQFFFYRGLSEGKASVIAPISSASPIVAIALSFIILGETLTIGQGLCIGAALIGILTMSSRSQSGGQSRGGIPSALASMFFIGAFFVAFKLASEEIGQMGAVFFVRSLVLISLLAVMPLFRNSSSKGDPKATSMGAIVVTGLAQFVGFIGAAVGVSVGFVSIVAPLSNSSPAVTVILAGVFLREKLDRIQKISVTVVLTAIILLSILSI